MVDTPHTHDLRCGWCEREPDVAQPVVRVPPRGPVFALCCHECALFRVSWMPTADDPVSAWMRRAGSGR